MDQKFKIFCDDSLQVLKTLPDNSIDSLVSDPPAGIGFLKLDWDKDKGGRDQWVAWMTDIMTECHRVLKPGAYGFVWAIPRTSHWTALSLESAGFQVKDVVTHVFGSGFPKSQSVDKMIQNSKRIDLTDVYKVTGWIRQRKKDKKLTNKDIDQFMGLSGSTAHWTARPGNEQAQIPSLAKWKKLKELLGHVPHHIDQIVRNYHGNVENPALKEKLLEASKKWKGWGTALKPASEHWILVQKPIKKRNIAANVMTHGTGALNIDASRIACEDLIPRTKNLDFAVSPFFGSQNGQKNRTQVYHPHKDGRFPANFVTSGSQENSVARQMDHESGRKVSHFFKNFRPDTKPYFYSPKPTKEEKGDFNTHPTVKPLSLMRYLIKMITPPNGIVLDPFMGSGTTGVAALFENFRFLGIEKQKEYFSICGRRLAGVQNRKKKNKNASPRQSTTKPRLTNLRKLVCTYDKNKGGSK
ncbi:MAG: site-specific DNA-methyltransferase [Pseudomonadota bacterium]